MSPTLAPPGPDRTHPVQVLFAAARRRRRRLRLTGLAVVLALALAAAGLAVTLTRHRTVPAGTGTWAEGGAAGAARAPLVAWVDYDQHLHLGSLATLRQRVVADADADPATPLVQAGGRLDWVDAGGGNVPGRGYSQEVIRQLDPATGKVRILGAGDWVFPSPDGRQLFISQPGDASLMELAADGSGQPRRLVLPASWHLPGGYSVAVGRGILVQSRDDRAAGGYPALAVWDPQARRLTVIGRGYPQMASAYTPAGGRSGLVAWIGRDCEIGQNCPIRITNLSTRSTRIVHSPRPGGFALGGAFSPNGRQLAAFVNVGASAELALVDTRTGQLRLVGSVRFGLGDDIAWAHWLPDGERLLAGGLDAAYVVTAATAASRPLYFFRGRDHYIEDSQDLNYSAVIIPARR
jgi:hypothetical protein